MMVQTEYDYDYDNRSEFEANQGIVYDFPHRDELELDTEPRWTPYRVFLLLVALLMIVSFIAMLLWPLLDGGPSMEPPPGPPTPIAPLV